ncbi:MAG: chemotaxis protein CheA [Nitrospinae bacterium]|nr:chemotaxis protein CheA [Nitrospinota bacterium]MBF0634893.1 chemotaxis protein CheA [Nitrospinota bacterium]
MSENDDNIDIIRDFVQESRDALESLEQAVIELGRNPGDTKSLNVIFRLFHSMKGTAGFLGFKNISSVTHAAESLLDLIRSGEMELRTPDHINLLIQAADFAKEALAELESSMDDKALSVKAEWLSSILHQALAKKPDTQAVEPNEAEPPAVAAGDEPQADQPENKPVQKPRAPDPLLGPEMLERFIQESDELLQKFEQDLLEWMKSPINMDVVSDAFRSIHSFKGNCGFFGFEDLEKLSHNMESLLDIIRTGGSVDQASVAEALLSLKDTLRNAVADISRGGTGLVKDLDDNLRVLRDISQGGKLKSGKTQGGGRLGEMLVAEGLVTKEALSKALDTQTKPLGEILVDMGATSPDAVNKVLSRQIKEKAGEDAKSKQGIIKRQDIRVDLEKLDSLITLIGELVIAENMMVNSPDLTGLPLENFGKAAKQTSKIVRELQELAMLVRMVPVSALFRRMIRLVHDLSAKCGKKADLILSGEETEVDKTIIEILTDPLVHMIRNSIDHGIETPHERRLAGKPEAGSVRLSASHEEGEVWIVVEDDGKGLNKEKILAKAVKLGLIGGDVSELSDTETYNLIFLPGFSTADQVSDVSGRGVGMDVVKQNLDKINCKIEVVSRPGKGLKFTLRIPLTLAIIDGMLIRVGGSRYILPITSIKESFCPKREAITISADGQELVRVREEFMPVLRLHELHKITPDSVDLPEGILIVLDSAAGNLALFVDEILGQQQTVIKGLSKYISDVGKVRGVSGCTILGNGEVCLILDVGGIVETTQDRAGAWAGAGD